MQKKVWGWTQPIFANDRVEVHRIAVRQGGYCSMHAHRNKLNQFFVESGHLRIRTFSGDLRPLQSYALRSGESLTVPTGVIHQFEAIAPSVAYEIYAVESSIDPNDIVRHSQGGIKRGEACEK